MLLLKVRHHKLLLQFADGIIGMLALLCAYLLRAGLNDYLSFMELNSVGEIERYWIFFPIIFFVLPTCLSRLNFYHVSMSHDNQQTLNLSTQAAIITFLCLVVFQYLTKEPLSRLIFAFFVPICAIYITARESVSYALRHKLRGQDLHNLAVITDRPGETEWQSHLEHNPQLGFKLDRELRMDDLSLHHFVELLHDRSINLVIFDLRNGSLEKMSELIRACEEEGIEAWLAGDFFQPRIARATVDYFGPKPLLIFRSTPDSSFQLLAKELIDRVGATIILTVLSPLLLAVALAVRWTSEGPVLFRQKRSGIHGQPFTMYKFRSMVTNADQKKIELEQLNEMSGPVFKITNDPRVTPIGTFIRKWSLDELPQLLNVVRGEMSLVGPRPLPTHETLAITENEQRRRLSMKPGITCLWQISGRSNLTDFREWVELDLKYIDNWSLALDLRILIMTPWVVLFAKGAK
ncbi:MAG: sugar transferase [Verrucomicrobiota bacterium]